MRTKQSFWFQDSTFGLDGAPSDGRLVGGSRAQASSGHPSHHGRGGLWQQPWQGWQHKGLNPIPSPRRHPSGETTDYRWCLMAHKTVIGASDCTGTQASYRSQVCHQPWCPGAIRCPHLCWGAPSLQPPLGHGSSEIVGWHLSLSPLPPQISLWLGFTSHCAAALCKAPIGSAERSDFVGKQSCHYMLSSVQGPEH